MTFLKRRTAIAVLAFAVLLSVALRYPLVEHERYQTDSYYIHMLSQSVVDDEYAVWTFHPLSYFGYYPLSYPSGVPFVVAEISLLAGLTVETSILLMGLAVGVVFCLAMFCAARLFLAKAELVLLATLLASLAPRFVDTTYWNGSARGPSAVLLLLVLLTCFRSGSTDRRMLLLLSGLFVFGCFATHHMAIILLLYGIGFIIATLGVKVVISANSRSRHRSAVIFFAGSAAVLTLASYGIFDYLLRSLTGAYGFTWLSNSEPLAFSILLNLGISYSGQIGPILLFSFLGVISFFRQTYWSLLDFFPLAAVVAAIPVFGQSLYMSLALMPLIVIIGIQWFKKTSIATRRTRVVHPVVVLLIASSILLAAWSIQRWNTTEYTGGDTVEIDGRVVNDAYYVRFCLGDGRIISNTKVVSSQICSISGSNLLSTGIYSIFNGDVDKEDVAEEITPSGAPFPTTFYIWLQYDDDQIASRSVNNLMINGLEYLQGAAEGSITARDYFSAHTNIAVVVDNRWQSNLVTDYAIVGAKFPSEVLDARFDSTTSSEYVSFPSYVQYRSSTISICIVGLFG